MRKVHFFAMFGCALLLAVPVRHATAQTAASAQFEVATIKPRDPDVPHTVGVTIYRGGRITISAVPLKTLITAAFRLSYWQVSGGAAWVEKDEYDLEAKPTETGAVAIKDLRHTWYGIEDAHLREMLQALLIDRFQLKFHRETKTGDVYTLQRSGKPLALRPTEVPNAGEALSMPGYVGGRWGISAMSMPQFAKFAADVLHAPVMDRTGLEGAYDYKQKVPDAEPKYGDNPDSFLNLITQLGLKLEKSKGPIEMFVIDTATKPSAN